MIVIALGANLNSWAGSPAETLGAALISLEKHGLKVLTASSFYKTPAWPDPSDPPFVNAAAILTGDTPPAALLEILHKVEAEYGRERGARNAPRTLDLDLIDYDGRVEEGPPVLPHPRMAERGFVLIPLMDIAPGWRHPVSGRTVSELIAALPESEQTCVVRLTRQPRRT